MPKNRVHYDILLSCPGDVDDTLPLIERVLNDFNNKYTDVLGIQLDLKHWSTNSYNQSGGKPQDLLNKQFVHDCDAAIAIFWAKFGTKTDRYGSGAEEEIEDMLAAGKQVFMYFCEKPVQPSLLSDDKAREQYQKIQDFKKRYKEDGKGIYATYSSDDEFEKKLFAHISQHFLTIQKNGIPTTRSSSLKVKGIVDSSLSDMAFIEKFEPNGMTSIDNKIVEIRALFNSISLCRVEPRALLHMETYMYNKIALPGTMVSLIRETADSMKIELPDDFFEIGALSENKFASATKAIYGHPSLYGTDEEIKKYNLLMELEEKIEELLNTCDFLSKFSELACIRLALTNEGTLYDDDIDIMMSFPADSFLKPDQLPVISKETCEHLINNHPLDELFGIPATSAYNDYDSSISTLESHGISNAHAVNPFNETDYEEVYWDDLSDTFQYEIFDEGGTIIVKLHVDYLKHNTAVAFPTVLFVSQELKKVDYTICSKQNVEEISGTVVIGHKDEA